MTIKLKHKFILPSFFAYLLLFVTMSSFGLAGSTVQTVSASSLNTDVACTDGSADLSANPSSGYGLTVTCQDGSPIAYLIQAQYDTVLQITVTCADPAHPGDQIAKPNQPNPKIIYYCYTGGEHDGQPVTKVNETAAFKVTGKKVSCADGTVVDDRAKCPGGATGGGKNACGGSVNGKDYPTINTTINFGCRGQGNPIMDLTFAIVRFLSTGVGLVLVASMVYAGIQYTSSRGDPQATAKAITRIRANVIALLLFMFAYAILNFVVPGAVLG